MATGEFFLLMMALLHQMFRHVYMYLHIIFFLLAQKPQSTRGKMEAPPVTVMPVTGGTINMMEYLLQGKISCIHRS